MHIAHSNGRSRDIAQDIIDDLGFNRCASLVDLLPRPFNRPLLDFCILARIVLAIVEVPLGAYLVDAILGHQTSRTGTPPEELDARD